MLTAARARSAASAAPALARCYPAATNGGNDPGGGERAKKGAARRTFYDDLGVDPAATSREIRDAYLSQSKRYHPDVNPDDPAALEKFQRASEAYDVVGNPRLRREYDRGTLGRTSSVAEREARGHRYQGDTFDEKRAAFRDEYGERSQELYRRSLDHYMRESTSAAFKNKRRGAGRRAEAADATMARPEPPPGRGQWQQQQKRRTHGGGGGAVPLMAITVALATLIMITRG